jgi:hypothetical protein
LKNSDDALPLPAAMWSAEERSARFVVLLMQSVGD